VKLTKKQKEEVLPHLQHMVDSIISAWESQRWIEGILGRNFDGMSGAAEMLAVTYDAGREVKLDDVQDYINKCREDK
jgi:hypothetical protein